MLYKITYKDVKQQIATGPGPFTAERIMTTLKIVYVKADSIQRIPDAVANFCRQDQIEVIEKLSDRIYPQ